MQEYRPPCPNCKTPMTPLFNMVHCRAQRCIDRFMGPLSRPSRVIGRVPDDWLGAAADMRRFEGHPVRLVLGPADAMLPSGVYWKTWSVPGIASASFDLSSRAFIDQAADEIRAWKRWGNSPPFNDAKTAETFFVNNSALLVID